jgi:hypothetical protein
MKNICRTPYCNNKIVPRKKGARGKHHNCCSKHLPHFKRISNPIRDVHRLVAFGEYRCISEIRCRGCKNSLLDHWNKHCRFLYRDIELTDSEKREIAYKLFQADHINGRKEEHFNSPKNLQLLCSNCHDSKSIFYGDNDGYRYKRG